MAEEICKEKDGKFRIFVNYVLKYLNTIAHFIGEAGDLILNTKYQMSAKVFVVVSFRK